MQVAPSTMKIFVVCFIIWAFINRGTVLASSLDTRKNDGQIENLEYILPPSLEGFSIDNYQKYGNAEEQQIDLETLNKKIPADNFFASSTRAVSKRTASSAALLSALNEKLDIKEGKTLLKSGEGALNGVQILDKPFSLEKSKKDKKEIGAESSKIKRAVTTTNSKWDKIEEESANEKNKRIVTKTHVKNGPVIKTWSWTSGVNESKSISSNEEIQLLKEEKIKAEAKIKTEVEARAKTEAEAAELRRQLKLQLKALREAQLKAEKEAEARAKAEVLVASESKALAAARAIAKANSEEAAQAEAKAKMEKEARSRLQSKIIKILDARAKFEKEIAITKEVKEKAKLSAEASLAASVAAREAAKAIRVAAMARANAATKALAAQKATLIQSIVSSNAKALANALSVAIEQATISSKAAADLQAEALAITNQAVKAAAAEGATIDYAKYRAAILENAIKRTKASIEAAGKAAAAAITSTNNLARLQINNRNFADNVASLQESMISKAETALVETNAAAREETAAMAVMDVEGSTIEAAVAARANPIQAVRNGVVIGLGSSATELNAQQAEALKKVVENRDK